MCSPPLGWDPICDRSSRMLLAQLKPFCKLSKGLPSWSFNSDFSMRPLLLENISLNLPRVIPHIHRYRILPPEKCKRHSWNHILCPLGNESLNMPKITQDIYNGPPIQNQGQSEDFSQSDTDTWVLQLYWQNQARQLILGANFAEFESALAPAQIRVAKAGVRLGKAASVWTQCLYTCS